MREEFHGIKYPEGPYKQLYGWNTLNAKVWLPSLSELIGTTGSQDSSTGCYKSAMQGLNASIYHYTDAKGGTQFAYFRQFNASGGGQAVMNVLNQEESWTRSPVFAYSNRANAFRSSGVNHDFLTASHAVHPAVKLRIIRLSQKEQGRGADWVMGS